MKKTLSIGAIIGLFLGLGASSGAYGLQYATSSQVLQKLQEIDPACQQIAEFYIPDPSCKTQTYLVEFANDKTQGFVENTNAKSLEASLELGSVSAFELTGFELANLARETKVLSISSDVQIKLAGSQASAPWTLDRLDQSSLPLNQTYNYTNEALGAGVRVYIVDTGINSAHSEFTGRIASGFSSIGSASSVEDCNGHGSHVSGLAAGTTYGAAKLATIVPVRVLDCDGTGSLLGVLQGLDWIAKNTTVGQAAVVNMSLGGEQNTYLDNAVTSLTSQGLAFVVAAGNSGLDACNTSPARVPGAITVAASSKTDSWPTFSNYGSCVDIIAPGVDAVSAWIGGASTLVSASGTSMAAGVVSGIVATQMSYGYQSPSALSSAITASAVSGIVTSVPAATPNLLLQNTISFSAPGSSAGSGTTGIDVPNDTTPISVVDPITNPVTPALPPTYLKPAVSVTGSAATISWVIPELTTSLTSQNLYVYSGSTLMSEVSLSASQTTYLLPDLVTGLVYRAKIAGVNANGVGVLSPESDAFSLEGVAVNGPSGGDFIGWTKLISSTQVKFYVKYPQLNQKVQFMLQQSDKPYREVAWTRISADRLDATGAYTDLTNGVYFIRTITLAPGKNRLRILVDGQLFGTTKTYSR